MREKQRLLVMCLKTQERGLDDLQKALIFKPNHGLCKKQRLQVTLHHQTSILQQDKDSLTIHKLQALRDTEYPLDTEQLKKTNVAPPPPPAQSSTPPKESGSSGGSAKKQSLEKYEQDYLARLDEQEREARELQQAAAELAAKRRASSGSTSSGGPSRGSLPKGF